MYLSHKNSVLFSLYFYCAIQDSVIQEQQWMKKEEHLRKLPKNTHVERNQVT